MSLLDLFRFRTINTLGLALGGGAARGLAHIGILKALEEEKLPVKVVSGTSVGSLIGALYCSGMKWHEIKDAAEKIKWGDLLKLKMGKMGLGTGTKLEKLVTDLTGVSRIEDLKIPFRAVAVDLVSGREVVFDHGPLGRAVHASSCIPGIFSPVDFGDMCLVDGGIRNSVPVNVVKLMGADGVIGVDLNSDRREYKPPNDVYDVIMYSLGILMETTNKTVYGSSDFGIFPDLSEFNYYNLNHMDEMIRRGEVAMRSRCSQIKGKLKKTAFQEKR
ncbi:MAG: patatin-like phospholipase family protein [Spirochaetia bacterium]